MCGIAGLWAPDLAPAERAEHVGRMIARLAHRGPDGVALWSDIQVTLGLARLAIVAPDSPTRVFANESARVHAVVNGEFYNHRDLTARLTAAGHEVPPGPDTATIVHLFEHYGVEFPRHVDGMFAIAIWDADRGRLVLARDRAGEKPLFTVTTGRRLAFASEPAALLELPWVARRPAPAAVLRYLVHGFFAAPDCAFEGLRQVPPGSVVECAAENEHVRHYWRPWDVLGLPRREITIHSSIESTRHQLERAVELCVPDEMPFGVFLSGGLDSSLITAAAARCARGFPTFSLALAGHGYDESEYAREVARHLGTEHRELAMDHNQGREALAALADMDQPLGDPSLIPTWYLARLASQHVPVVLTGEGGDELFAGYPTYLGHRHAARLELLPRALTDLALALARRARPADRHLSLAFFVERFLGARGMQPLERHQLWFGNFGPLEARALLAPDLAASVESDAALAHIIELRGALETAGLGHMAQGSALLTYQVFDFLLSLGGGLLTKVDRSTMAHGLESRAPFLRADMVEHALTLPDNVKLRGVSGKWILKQVAKDLLPARVISRRKQGFSPPFSAWARGPWRDHLRDVLAPARVARAGVLDPDRVTNVLERHVRGEAELGRALWSLVSLELWAERWLLGGAGVPPDPGIRRARLKRGPIARVAPVKVS